MFRLKLAIGVISLCFTWSFTDSARATQFSSIVIDATTGRTLHQIRRALPHAELTGTDLSEAYLRQANRWLNSDNQGLVQFVRANAESLPLASNSIQAATCVFLFHELPGEARQNVINDAWRVLEPGGVFVIADSVQLADSPQFSTAMENFRRVFHEPYYRDYIEIGRAHV